MFFSIIHRVLSGFCNRLDWEERAGCLALFVFLVSGDSSCLCLFLTVPCVGLQCVILVFPDHNHFLFFTL